MDFEFYIQEFKNEIRQAILNLIDKSGEELHSVLTVTIGTDYAAYQITQDSQGRLVNQNTQTTINEKRVRDFTINGISDMSTPIYTSVGKVLTLQADVDAGIEIEVDDKITLVEFSTQIIVRYPGEHTIKITNGGLTKYYRVIAFEEGV